MSGKKLLGLCLLAGLAACAKPKYEDAPGLKTAQKLELNCSQRTTLCHTLTWESLPTESTMGSFRLEFFDGDLGRPVTNLPGELSVVLWMPSMGHGSSPVRIEALSPGVYRVSRVFFIMPGQWEIRVQIKNGSDVVDETVQTVSI